MRVCVRVRPLSAREVEAGARPIVSVDGSRVVLGEGAGAHAFAFDAAFAGDAGDVPGDQERVWASLEPHVVPSALRGFNVSLFAYGQTASGKSHTMFGGPGVRGVIPRYCGALFDALDGDCGSCDVTASVVELYNESPRDLLSPFRRDADPLRVRDAPTTGCYVEGAKVVRIRTAAELLALMRLGSRNRTLAATAMNESSSRAHTARAGAGRGGTFSQRACFAILGPSRGEHPDVDDLKGGDRSSEDEGRRERPRTGASKVGEISHRPFPLPGGHGAPGAGDREFRPAVLDRTPRRPRRFGARGPDARDGRAAGPGERGTSYVTLRRECFTIHAYRRKHPHLEILKRG